MDWCRFDAGLVPSAPLLAFLQCTDYKRSEGFNFAWFHNFRSRFATAGSEQSVCVHNVYGLEHI